MILITSLYNLIYDWETHFTSTQFTKKRVEVNDQTLRDGRQSPAMGRDASIKERQLLLYSMDSIGIDVAEIGFPAAGHNEVKAIEELARYKVQRNLNISLGCAARTIQKDIEPIAKISQKIGIPIEVGAFIGSSPIRQYVEEWKLDEMIERSVKAVSFAIKENLPVMFVTEDTTRSRPEDIIKLYQAAIDTGAKRICLCDTVGAATPKAVYNLVRFTHEEILKGNYAKKGIKIDFHGHRDRGLAQANALAAIKAGADRIHACANGMGERAGNLEMEFLLCYLLQENLGNYDLQRLMDYCDFACSIFEFNKEDSEPITGRYAFTTATGVHASAILKAMKKGDKINGISLAELVYCGIPPSNVGRQLDVRVGPMSGKANAQWIADKLGIESEEFIDILLAEKNTGRLLSNEEIMEIAKPYFPLKFYDLKKAI